MKSCNICEQKLIKEYQINIKTEEKFILTKCPNYKKYFGIWGNKHYMECSDMHGKSLHKW